jgi:esterase
MIELFHKRMGQGKPLVILHGLFGSGDNFGSVAKELSETFDTVVVDQRDHGRSPHTDRIAYPLMADDVKDLIVQLGLEEPIVVGHSMGGKTGMVLAQRPPRALVQARHH